MVGSFHESMIPSRLYSSGGDGNARNSIDENSTYDDLMKVKESLSNKTKSHLTSSRKF